MSRWPDLSSLIRSFFLMRDAIDRLQLSTDQMGEKLTDHDRRLVRIETMIEMAQANRLSRE